MRTSWTTVCSLAVLSLGLGINVSCDSGPDADVLSTTVPEATAEAAGSVVGTVRFLETPPDPERLRVEKDNDVCGLRKFSQDFIVSPETQGLKNVVLTIVGASTPSTTVSAEPPSLYQQECVYGPHVQTAVVGQQLEVTNRDDLLHNIHGYTDTLKTLFNVAEPVQNMVLSLDLEREGVVTVKCDIHSWMQAYVVVAPHPFTAVTDENGTYRIDGIPPGSYQVRAWHEALGELDKPATVGAERETTVNFDVGK